MEMEGLGRVLPSAALLRNPFFSCSTAPPRAAAVAAVRWPSFVCFCFCGGLMGERQNHDPPDKRTSQRDVRHSASLR